MKQLCGLILFCSFLWTPFAMSAQIATFSAGPAENIGLSIDAKLLTVAPVIGKPILVEITVTNTSDKIYSWWIDLPEAEYQNFTFALVDDHNIETKRTSFHRLIRGEWEPGDENRVLLGNRRVLDLVPGKQVIYRVNLVRLFQIDHPGLYTLSISTKERVSKTAKVTFSVAAE